MDITERVAIVTGSAFGIGRGIAMKLAEEGAKVVINARTQETVDETVKMIQKTGGIAIGVAADISKISEVDVLTETTIKEFGKIDILVNNAGNYSQNFIVNMTEQQWDEVVDVHLKGTFLCTQAAARNMRQNKFGRVINIASEGTFFGNIGMANYVSSKAGMFGLTLTAAREFAHWVRKEGCNMTCNCLTPGYNPSRMTEALIPKVKKRFEEGNLMGRVADSKEDIGSLVAFLASEEASCITAALIAAGGGHHLEAIHTI